MINPLIWFLTLELTGILLFPLIFIIFARLPDRGYSICKIFFLLLIGYLTWISGLTHIIPNSFITIFALIVLLISLSIYIFLKNRAPIISFLRSEWPMLLVGDCLFLVIFVFWILIASQHPAINHTEKPMDFAFLNAIISSTHFPSEDPWFSGHPISYYYFGHLIIATLAKVTFTPLAIAYNIAISLIPALLAIGSFGLIYNLIRLSNSSRKISLIYSVITPALLLFMSNLQVPLEIAHTRGWFEPEFWDWAQIKGLNGINNSSSGFFPTDTWWWWRATRVVDTLVSGQSLDYTITEFPLFSFILGDLHPHVLSLPFLVLFLSLMSNMYLSPFSFNKSWIKRNPLEYGSIALILGSIAFINLWDAPTYLLLLILLVFAKALLPPSTERIDEVVYPKIRDLLIATRKTIGFCFPIFMASILLFLPFYLSLHGQIDGISPYYGPGTRIFHFIIVMGIPLILSLLFLFNKLNIRYILHGKTSAITTLVLVISFTPITLWLLLKLLLPEYLGLFATHHFNPVKPLTIALPCTVILFFSITSSFKASRTSKEQITSYLSIILGVGLLLLTGSELYYLLDPFGNRMNTVFKTYYQAWLLLMVVGSYGIYCLISIKPKNTVLIFAQRICIASVILIISVSLYYPIGAILERRTTETSPTALISLNLDGLKFIQHSDPGEYQTIHWLLKNSIEGPILEAVGDDYSEHGRISSSTGIPTLLGWKGHEFQWRGSANSINKRELHVAEIYQTTDSIRRKYLLDKYRIKYIYVGVRERAKYPKLNLESSDRLQQVFYSDTTTLYKVVPK